MTESSTSSYSIPQDIESSIGSDSPKDNTDELNLNTPADNSNNNDDETSGNNDDVDDGGDNGNDNDDGNDNGNDNGNANDNGDNDDGGKLETTKDTKKSVSDEKKVKPDKNKFKAKTPKRYSRSVKKSRIAGGCGIIFLIILVFVLVNILNICAIGIGSANYYDDEGICQGRYGFPLSEWLVIVGCMGTFMTTGAVIVGLISESALGGNIVQIIWFLPEFALWVCGIVILNNLENDSCKEDFRKVWDMSVAWCVLRGIGFFSLCCVAAGN